MAMLFKTEKKMALKCDYEQRHLAKTAGGKWNPDTKTWDFPDNTSVVKQLEQSFPDLRLSGAITLMMAAEAERALRLSNLKDYADAELSVDYADKLRDYQRVGVQFLTEAKQALLADEMGTGKTLQSITACEEVGAQHVLVVCPASLKWNWHDEVTKWTGKEAQVVAGPKKKREEQISEYDRGYLIINYESLKLHPEILKRTWDVLICDEAHKIKNRKTQQTKVVKKVKADRVFLLTGTPILNRAEELYSLLQRLYPKKYTSYWRFVEQFCQQRHNGFGVEVLPGTEDQLKELRNELQPIMLRRTKKEVMSELPDKVYVRHVIELEGKQRKIYDQMYKEAMAIIDDEVVAAPVVIAQITRLRQIAISPQLLNDDTDISAKVDALIELLEDNLEGHKIVVFSQFRTAIELVGRKLSAKGYKWVSVTGGVKESQRHENTRAFQEDPETRIMLATIEAAGLGLTWTSADIAIFLDRHWTPGINRQAEDRLHRMGQKNSVTIINMVAKDTVEEYIEDLLDSKQEIADAVVEKEELIRAFRQPQITQ